MARFRKKTIDQFVDEAISKHGNIYDYSKCVYNNAHSKVIIICKIHGEFEKTPRNHLFGRNNKGQGCPSCAKLVQHDSIRFNNKQIDHYLKNKPIKRIDDYFNSIKLMTWQCLICDNLWKTSSNSIRQGNGCPVCNNTKLNNQKVDARLSQFKCLIKRLDDYVNIYTKINWLCIKCNNIWIAAPYEILRPPYSKKGGGSGCPDCARLKNEKIIGKFLKENNFSTQKLVIKLSDNQKAIPDYYVPSLNLIIEYNGIQHYRPTQFGSMSIEKAKQNFTHQEQRDNNLRLYCKNNGLNLLEIDGRKYKGFHLIKYLKKYFNIGE